VPPVHEYDVAVPTDKVIVVEAHVSSVTPGDIVIVGVVGAAVLTVIATSSDAVHPLVPVTVTA